jgi:hypothetical protein
MCFQGTPTSSEPQLRGPACLASHPSIAHRTALPLPLPQGLCHFLQMNLISEVVILSCCKVLVILIIEVTPRRGGGVQGSGEPGPEF